MPSSTHTMWDSTLCPTFSETLAVTAFNFVPHFSAKKFLPLYHHYGSGTKAWEQVSNTAALEKAKKELDLAQKHGITLIPITSPDYPSSIKQLSDAPLILYVKGSLPPPNIAAIGIVGTRVATNWGIECTTKFARYLSNIGAWVISGLARGIDTAAHTASLERTCAIIGSGLLHIYPTENIPLAEKICQHGSIISELPLLTPPTRFSFPRRNRLISAMSSALLLMEAPVKSGAMITMDIGIKQNKPLFAVPGRAMDENYAGNHNLLKTGKAQLVESPQELATKMGIFLQKMPENGKMNIENGLISPPEQKILDILYQSEVSIDVLSVKTCLPIAILQVLLTKLVLRKLAVELPGKRYKKAL